MSAEAIFENVSDGQKAVLARKQLEAAIIVRAWQDDEFRQRLLSEPRAAVEEMGMEISTDVSVSVTEEEEATLQIVLPARPEGADLLSQAQLEKIAGGVNQRGLF